MFRRTPLEPEAKSHPRDHQHLRLRKEDPPESTPAVTLNARQLQLLESKRSQGRQPFITRSNVSGATHLSEGGARMTMKDNRIRTPNPISRSIVGGSNASTSTSGAAASDTQRTFLRQMLTKASSASSSAKTSTSTSHERALLQRVLAKSVVVTKKQRQAPLRSGPRSEKLAQAVSAASVLRERHRAATVTTAAAPPPPIETESPAVELDTSLDMPDDERQVTSPVLEMAQAVMAKKSLRLAERTPIRLRLTEKMLQQKEQSMTNMVVEETFRQQFRPDDRLRLYMRERLRERQQSERRQGDTPSGYDQFFETLRNEVSGQHSQLWSSFHAVMTGQAEPDIITVRANKEYKFDAATKGKLVAMNQFLKKSKLVECLAETQLVNDKKWLKQRTLLAVEPHFDVTTPPLAPEFTVDRANISHETVEKRPAASGITKQSIGSAVEASGNLHNVRPRQPVPQQMSPGSPMEARGAIASTSLAKMVIKNDVSGDPVATTRVSSALSGEVSRFSDAVSRARTDSFVGSDLSREHQQLRHMQALTDVMSGSQEEDVDEPPSLKIASATTLPTVATSPSENGSSTLDSGSNGEVEVTLGQFKSKILLGSSPASSSSSTPWSGIQLRALRSNSPTSSEISLGSVPWANVKLKNVRSDEESSKNRLREGHRSYEEVISLCASPQSFAPEASNDVVHTAERQSATISALPAVSTPSLGSVSAAIPEYSSPNDRSDEAVVFPLRAIGGTTYNDVRLIAGTNVLMLLRGRRDESAATVLWKMPRIDVLSLKLDMATLQVELSLASARMGDKVLQFTSAADCLRFANTFYDTPASASLPSECFPSVDQESLDSMSISERVEKLNDEEQSVLETYRRLRRMKSADDALQECVSSDLNSLKSHPPSVPATSQLLTLKEMPYTKKRPEAALDDVASLQNKGFLPTFVGKGEMPHSPLSTMSSSQGLTADEIKLAESYLSMLKLRIPSDAVEHKMRKDSVDQKIVAFVLSGVSSVVALSVDSTNLHKGESGFDSLSAEEQDAASTYKRMRSVGIPDEAVRHKMMKDGVGQRIMTAVLGAKGQQTNRSTEGAAERRITKTDESLTAEEDSVAQPFRKLLKLQVSRNTVLERMQNEGVGENIMEAVLGKAGVLAVPEAEKTLPSVSNANTGSRLVSLHWTPLTGSDLGDNSVWRSNRKRKAELVQPEGSDICKLVHLFQKKTNVAPKKTNLPSNSALSGKKVKLIDLTRSNNVAISLKAFKEFSYRELAVTIAQLDPDRKLKGERVLFLRDLLPSMQECKIIESFQGTDDQLDPAELWFKYAVCIKRIDAKERVLRTMETFQNDAACLTDSFHLLSSVCHQIMDSERLQDVLEMVLRIGNVMNEGTRTGGAIGFRFDTLLRLTQTKSADGKTTVLDFLVSTFVAKGMRETLHLSQDFPECHAASRLVVSDLVNDIKSLRVAFDCCRDELNAMQDEHDPGRPGQFGKLNEDRMPQANLLSAIRQHATNVTENSDDSRLGHREKFLNSIDQKKSQSEQSSSKLRERRSWDALQSRDPALTRLRDFILAGDAKLNLLEEVRDKALGACNGLAKYCAESGGVQATSKILVILAEFASNLRSALKKFDTKRDAETKLMIRPTSRDQNETSVLAPARREEPYAGKNERSLVLLVNEMLLEANERTKEDFKKGRVYKNPSSSLSQIYEKEQRVIVDPSQVHKPTSHELTANAEVVNVDEVQLAVAISTAIGHISEGEADTTTTAGETDQHESFCDELKALAPLESKPQPHTSHVLAAETAIPSDSRAFARLESRAQPRTTVNDVGADGIPSPNIIVCGSTQDSNNAVTDETSRRQRFGELRSVFTTLEKSPLRTQPAAANFDGAESFTDVFCDTSSKRIEIAAYSENTVEHLIQGEKARAFVVPEEKQKCDSPHTANEERIADGVLVGGYSECILATKNSSTRAGPCMGFEKPQNISNPPEANSTSICVSPYKAINVDDVANATTSSCETNKNSVALSDSRIRGGTSDENTNATDATLPSTEESEKIFSTSLSIQNTSKTKTDTSFSDAISPCVLAIRSESFDEGGRRNDSMLQSRIASTRTNLESEISVGSAVSKSPLSRRKSRTAFAGPAGAVTEANRNTEVPTFLSEDTNLLTKSASKSVRFERSSIVKLSSPRQTFSPRVARSNMLEPTSKKGSHVRRIEIVNLSPTKNSRDIQSSTCVPIVSESSTSAFVRKEMPVVPFASTKSGRHQSTKAFIKSIANKAKQDESGCSRAQIPLIPLPAISLTSRNHGGALQKEVSLPLKVDASLVFDVAESANRLSKQIELSRKEKQALIVTSDEAKSSAMTEGEGASKVKRSLLELARSKRERKNLSGQEITGKQEDNAREAQRGALTSFAMLARLKREEKRGIT